MRHLAVDTSRQSPRVLRAGNRVEQGRPDSIQEALRHGMRREGLVLFEASYRWGGLGRARRETQPRGVPIFPKTDAAINSSSTKFVAGQSRQAA